MFVLNLFLKAVILALYMTLKIAAGILAALLAIGRRLFWQSADTYGTSRWARLYELMLAGVWGLKPDGIIVGKSWWRFLTFSDPGYALLFARARSGKGVGLVVPNLLNYQGSIICTDPKSENSSITDRHRRKLGETFILNAIHPELSDCFNPLMMVRTGTYHEADDALELAHLLVIPDSSNGGHWDNRAAQVLKTLILFVCLKYADDPNARNLSTVRSLIARGPDGLAAILDEAKGLGSTSLREGITGLKSVLESQEAKSVFSNADKAMDLWSADRPAGLISQRSDFDFADFNRKVMTCFICVDEEKIYLYAGFLRVMMGCALMAMTRAKSEAKPDIPTLFLLDEAAAMGRIQPLEDGIAYLGAYAKMLLVFQDLDQVQKTYPKARSMIANAACKVAFGVNDLETAKMLAETIGKKTVRSHSAGQSRNSADPFTKNNNEGQSETGRYLLDPAEIMRLSPKKAIVFFNGAVRFPVLARKVRYYKERRWKRLWDTWRPAKRHDIVPFPPTPMLPKPDNHQNAA
jgi:type IV secretion system protein VirD4